MEVALSKEDRAFAQEMRAFFTTEIPADIREKLGRGLHPTKDDIVISQRILNDHGLAVPHWPVEWGGRNWTPLQRHLWSEEMTRAHVPHPIVFNTAMVGPVIATFGSQQLKERFLPKTASAEIWWSQGFSEPNAGSDLASLKTSAVRADGVGEAGAEYVVNGQKTWTTYAQHGDWIFCLVRTDPDAQQQRGISFLLIDMRSPGVTVRPIRLIDGGYEVNEVFFDNVRVPVDQLVGEENNGWTYAKFLLGNERTSNAGVGLIKNRIARIKRLAGPLLDDPLLRARLTRLEVETTALEMSVLRVLAREASLPPGMPDPVSSVLKLRGSELQQDASELLVDVMGPAALAYRESGEVPDGFAALREGAVDALPTYFNWRKASIYAGSNEVQRQIIAKAILKF
jgi:alkylation response protein AidB-like acyl-CoA dehydrogenase